MYPTAGRSTGKRRPHLPTSVVRTAIVCLPAGTPTADLPQHATQALTVLGLTAAGVLPHFRTRTRRTGRLLDHWQGWTSGGPRKLLDLDGMRRTAVAVAAAEWQLWNQVVKGTRPANPFWWYLDKHNADPQRYSLARAQSEYQTQPRIIAMTAHNALPHRPCRLRIAMLEAFQAGYRTYLNVALLAAVPADGLVPEHGGWLGTPTQRLHDQLGYLTVANAHLAGLHPDTNLVAVAIEV